jgi:hypothetical protein
MAAAVFCRFAGFSDPGSALVGAALAVFFFFDALAFGEALRALLLAGEIVDEEPLPLTLADETTGAGRLAELDFVDLDPFDFLLLLFIALFDDCGGCGGYMGCM